jgi:peptidoglycan/xylan/chitin deacetylase (PgdA/CDA1 family)
VATFFVVGSRVRALPYLVRREAAEGHEVGDHSWSHPNLARLAPGRVQQELRSTQLAVQEVTGVTPRIFRPPYGATNGAVAAVAGGFGLPVILWSVDTVDWRDRNAALITQRALAGASPGGIILLHDVYGSTAAAVLGIVRALQASGYSLVTVDDLLGPGAARAAGSTFTRRP